jgi:hypothetical protein
LRSSLRELLESRQNPNASGYASLTTIKDLESNQASDIRLRSLATE